MKLIVIRNEVYMCSFDDLKKLNWLKDRWMKAMDNESVDEEDLSEELYRLEEIIIKRSRFIGFVEYKA